MGDQVPKTIGDFVTLQRGTTYRGDLVGAPGPALLGLGSIEPGGGFRADHYKTFGGDCPEKLTLHPGDIYVALKGATKDGSMIGSVARVPRTIASGRLTQDTAKLQFLQPDSETARYVYWVLRTPQYRDYCAGRATGTTAVALNRADFFAYPVPSVNRQTRRLVELFEAIDEKIELNRRMNVTLEAIARAIFKAWFVDFDPVRKKIEDGEANLPPDLDVHFPRSFDASPIGPVPAGWDVGIVEDLFVLQRGFDLPKQARTTGIYPVVSAGGPNGNHCSYRVRGPGVVTGRSGRLGGVWFIDADFWPLNTALWVKEYRAAGPLWTYHYLHCAGLQALNSGSAVPTLNRNHLHRQTALIPPAPLASAFERLAQPLFAGMATNRRQSNSLERARDELLPWLMSGCDGRE